MKSPFPGMDPYLEAYWGDVHASLTLYARDQLTPQLPADLVARVEEYLGLETDEEEAPPGYYPDVQVHEENGGTAGTAVAVAVAAVAVAAVAVADPVVIPLASEPPTLRTIRIHDRNSGNRVITAIEFLSPFNKTHERRRLAYRRKQRDFLEGGVSLVEIDLHRTGSHILVPALSVMPVRCRGPYRISVVRGWRRDQAEVYPVPLRERLPAFRIPLRRADADAIIDLQPLVERCYENGRYDRGIDYRADADPPLQGDDAAWADQLLREKGKR